MPLRFLCEKLVRDKTPARYEAEKSSLITRRLNDVEFTRELNKKLIEEANEIVQATSCREELVGELADIQEVLRSIACHHGISLEEVEASRLQKLEERGGFSDRLYSSIGIINNPSTPLASIITSKPSHYLILPDERLELSLEANSGTWKRTFGQLKSELFQSLPEYIISALHIGTTSLSSTPAQPIIDIAIAVTSLLDFDLNSRSLMRHGWITRGEMGINNRRLFINYDSHNGKEVARLHCFEYTDPMLKRFVTFTNLLRDSSELREAYTRLRQDYLQEPSATYTKYAEVKKHFIEQTLGHN